MKKKQKENPKQKPTKHKEARGTKWGLKCHIDLREQHSKSCMCISMK